MTPIPISLATQLRELNKLCDHYRERNLILSEAFEQQDAVLKERDKTIAERDRALAELQMRIGDLARPKTDVSTSVIEGEN